MTEGMVIRTKVKEFVTNSSSNKKLRISDDFCDSLNINIEKIVEKACERARENKRTTVMPRDL